MTSATNILIRHRYAAQVLLIVVLTATLSYLTAALNYQSGWNALWMFLLPLTIGFALNRGMDRRSFMALVLPIIAFATVVITGAIIGNV